MSFQYREHRGSLAASMETVVTLETAEDLLNHLLDSSPFLGLQIIRDSIVVEPYAVDSRIGWDTHIVRGSYGIPGSSMMVLGFTDKFVDLPSSRTQPSVALDPVDHWVPVHSPAGYNKGYVRASQILSVEPYAQFSTVYLDRRGERCDGTIPYGFDRTEYARLLGLPPKPGGY